LGWWHGFALCGSATALQGHQSIAAELVRAGIDFNLLDTDGESAEMEAVQKGHHGVAKYLRDITFSATTNMGAHGWTRESLKMGNAPVDECDAPVDVGPS
jgi:hypothetical protein